MPKASFSHPPLTPHLDLPGVGAHSQVSPIGREGDSPGRHSDADFGLWAGKCGKCEGNSPGRDADADLGLGGGGVSVGQCEWQARTACRCRYKACSANPCVLIRPIT